MFWRARLFALYLLSLRLDTSFHSLHTVIQFVNQCNTIITAFTKVSLPEVWLRMLWADRGALGSSTGCLAHGSSLRAAMELIAQPAASHMVSTLACQAPRRWTVQHGMEMQEQDNWSTQRRKPEWATRFIVALAMVVAVRRCAAEAQPLDEKSGNTNTLSWKLFLRPPDRLLHLASQRIIF